MFGLAAVRNVGEGLVERIVAERNANGPFEDIFDFCARVDPVVLNKRTMESLVKGGAFDSLGHPRQGLCLVFEEIVDRTLERRTEQDLGITSLFAALEEEQADPGWGGTKVAIPDTEFDKSQRLAFEKEMLGLYVSDHPLMGFEGALTRHTDSTLSDMREEDIVAGDRSPVRIGRGRGDRPAPLLHEEGRPDGPVRPRRPAGGHGGLRVPQDHGRVRGPDRERRHRGHQGRLDTREEEPKIVCMEVSRPLLDRGEEDLHIKLPLGVLTDRRGRGSQGGAERPPGALAGASPRRRKGAEASARVQRRLPQRPRGRAQAAAGSECRSLLNGRDAPVRNGS